MRLSANRGDDGDRSTAAWESQPRSRPASSQRRGDSTRPAPVRRERGLRDATQQHNTHIRDIREICYSWHPWHGRAVRVHASLVRRDQAVTYCSLEEVQACRVLEVPLWMLDVAVCCRTRLCEAGFASAQSLRELKEVLQAAQSRSRASAVLKTEHRYSLNAGGADGGIGGVAEVEPTPVVCSSAMEPTLDQSVVRCSTKDRAIAGAVAETASRGSGKRGKRRGGAR